MENRARIVREAVLWAVALLLVSIFARQGIAKFSDTGGWAQAFRLWHYPTWFRLAIGTAEIVAALLVLLPRTAFAGALVIAVVMLGAMGTHVWWHHPEQVTNEIFPLLLASVLLLGRRKSFVLSSREHRVT